MRTMLVYFDLRSLIFLCSWWLMLESYPVGRRLLGIVSQGENDLFPAFQYPISNTRRPSASERAISSLPGEDRFSFLEEGRDALYEVCGAETFALPRRLEFERGGEVGLQAVGQSGFDFRERDGGGARQSVGHRVDRRVEFTGRHDAIEHAHLEGLLRRDGIAERHQFESLVVSDQTRQEVSPAAVRHQPDLDEGLAEEGLVRRDDDVGDE